MRLLTFPWVVSVGQWGAEVGEGEHRQRDQRVGAVEAKGAAGDQPDLGVDLLGAGVAEPVAQRRLDPGALVADRAREANERLQAAAPGPPQPGVQDADRVIGVDAIDQAQLLLEQVGAVQALVDTLDVGEFALLARRQLRVLRTCRCIRLGLATPATRRSAALRHEEQREHAARDAGSRRRQQSRPSGFLPPGVRHSTSSPRQRVLLVCAPAASIRPNCAGAQSHCAGARCSLRGMRVDRAGPRS